MQNQNQPVKFSILLATVNRADILEQTLESFSKLNELDQLCAEIIVVDNGSTDGTEDVIEHWESKLPLVSQFISTPGKNTCLNAALPKATGDYYIFTDDDVVADPMLLQSYREIVRKYPDELLFCGFIKPRFPKSTPDWIKDLSPKYSVIYSECSMSTPAGPTRKAPLGPNMMVKADVFGTFQYDETIGPSGSNYAMGSETEFLNRVQKSTGCNYIYVPDAKVEHIVRDDQINMSWLLGRAFRAGRGMARQIQTNRFRIAGVPWTISTRTLLARIRCLMVNRNQPESCFDVLWENEKLSGCIYEYRNFMRSNEKAER